MEKAHGEGAGGETEIAMARRVAFRPPSRARAPVCVRMRARARVRAYARVCACANPLADAFRAFCEK